MNNELEKVRLEPMFKRIIVEFEQTNPYRKRKTDSQIWLPNEKELQSFVDKEENGLVAGGEQRVRYGVVVEVSQDCVSGIQVGDEVIADSFAGMTPIMGITDLLVLPETSVIQIIRKYND